jgi:hypothetical protein
MCFGSVANYLIIVPHTFRLQGMEIGVEAKPGPDPDDIRKLGIFYITSKFEHTKRFLLYRYFGFGQLLWFSPASWILAWILKPLIFFINKIYRMQFVSKQLSTVPLSSRKIPFMLDIYRFCYNY